MGINLGVLTKDNLSLVLDVSFNPSNVDVTGRHTPITGSGVSYTGSVAQFAPGNTGLAYQDNLQDFACSGNWQIEGRFALSLVSGSYFFSLCPYPSYSYSDLAVYMTTDPTPRLAVSFGQVGVSSLHIDTSIVTITEDVFYTIRLKKINDTFYLYVGNVLVGQKKNAAFATMNKTGKLLQLFGESTGFTNAGACDYVKVWD